jgi:ATP-dependent protease ClpP protease subunit
MTELAILTALAFLLVLGIAALAQAAVEFWRWGKLRKTHAAAEPEAPRAVPPVMTYEAQDTATDGGTTTTSGPSTASTESNAMRYPLLARPHVHLSGTVDHSMYASFRDQLSAAPREGALVIAISTLGGDPEVARLMGDEIRLLREYDGREFLFLGKVAVYSAGATFMSAFPVDKRFLTKGTRIMVHERILTSTIQLAGPLKSLTAGLKAKLHEIEHSILIEEEGFRDLVAGSKVGFDEVQERAPSNWYIEAEEARDLGLVLDVI